MAINPAPFSPKACQEIIDDIRLDFLINGGSYDESIKEIIRRDLIYWEKMKIRAQRGEIQYRREAA